MRDESHDVTYSWSDDGWFQLNEHSPGGIHQVPVLRFHLHDHVTDGWTDGTFTARLLTREIDGTVIATLELTNVSDTPQPVPSINVEFGHLLRAADWFAAFFSYVVFWCTHPGSLIVFMPEAGGYTRNTALYSLSATRMLTATLQPGAAIRTSWRGHWYQSIGETYDAVTPPWYPRQAVVEQGEAIELEFPDGVIDGEALRLTDDYPRTLVRSVPGVHYARFVLPVGNCHVALGWARPLRTIVAEALAGEVDEDVRAWLLAWNALTITPDEAQLDELDLAVAAALTDPTPFGIAAAADASPLLGRSLLSDAIAGLEAIADDANERSGTYLAATHVWAQALAQGSTAADAIVNHLWRCQTNASIEGSLLIDPSAAPQSVDLLMAEAGFCLPGPVPHVDTYHLALLKLAVNGSLESDQLAFASWVHQTAEMWMRCLPLTAAEVAWLLW